MTSSAEWKKDRARFLRLIQDHDPYSDIPVAIRLDLTPEEARVIVGHEIEDFEEARIRCATFVQNFLAPEVDRLRSHLAWKVMGGR